jgi:hypothetical protein
MVVVIKLKIPPAVGENQACCCVPVCMLSQNLSLRNNDNDILINQNNRIVNLANLVIFAMNFTQNIFFLCIGTLFLESKQGWIYRIAKYNCLLTETKLFTTTNYRNVHIKQGREIHVIEKVVDGTRFSIRYLGAWVLVWWVPPFSQWGHYCINTTNTCQS